MDRADLVAAAEARHPAALERAAELVAMAAL
jgi:hypothetical protein